MSADGSTDMAANAWPGFVDILSAVVIMFVFFVLITAAVLYFYTITYKAKIEGQVSQESTLLVASSQSEKVEELERENQELREQIEAVQSTAAPSEVESQSNTEATNSFSAQTSEQEILASDEDLSLVLFHDSGAITVDQQSVARISDFVERLANTYGAQNIEIVLTSPKVANAATQSQAKRVAVARMLNVRNALLESSVSRENIGLSVVESEEVEDSDQWTRLQINILK